MMPETREKLAHWVQDGVKLFPHLPLLFHGDEVNGARVADLERECDRLRKEAGDLRRELDELRREHERLQMERDEVTQAFSKLMDSVQPINQIAQKLGVKRSPFERTTAAPPPKP
ncbi:MAG: hypothetical protein ACREM3_29945 [Candidatus Rokuibacteriota bacterium]